MSFVVLHAVTARGDCTRIMVKWVHDPPLLAPRRSQERHCVNSVSVKFVKGSDPPLEEKPVCS